jgi:hypothetical protein
MFEVLINDPGGFLGAHIALGKSYAALGAKLAVKYCASACLMLLAQVPQQNVCFYDDAWIGTHAQYDHAEIARDMIWERGRDWIKQGYGKCDH